VRTFEQRDEQGRLRAFEIENVALDRRGVAALVRQLPGVRVLRAPRLLSWWREETFCEFELGTIRFSASEPFGDNSCYWIAPKEPGAFHLSRSTRRTFGCSSSGISPTSSQEHEFERLGGTRTIHVDVRLVAATGRKLAGMVDAGCFRDDLYYRLNVFPIAIPPLRERREDIDALVDHFVAQFASRMNRHIDVIPSETREALRHHPWPGNVRELENVIQRAVILSPGGRLTLPALRVESPPRPSQSALETLEGIERAYVVRVLEDTHWVIGGPWGAATRLGLKRTTLQSMIKRFGLPSPRDVAKSNLNGHESYPGHRND